MDNGILLPELVKVLIDNICKSSYIVTGMCYIMCLINVDMNLGQFVCLNQIISDSKCTDINYPFKTRTIMQALKGENMSPNCVWAAN